MKREAPQVIRQHSRLAKQNRVQRGHHKVALLGSVRSIVSNGIYDQSLKDEHSKKRDIRRTNLPLTT
jgi:hypothetical protein